MSELTLKDLSDKMSSIDFAMLSTRSTDGAVASRPMSNNGEVDYRGDSYFFADQSASMVADIASDPLVGLTYTGAPGLFGGSQLFIAIEGKAELIHDPAQFKEHWTSGLDTWFDQGVDTPGLVMIKVHAERLHYWKGADSRELML